MSVRQIRVSSAALMRCATYQQARAIIEAQINAHERVVGTRQDDATHDLIIDIKAPDPKPASSP